MAGAPIGNQNSAKGKRWKSVIEKRLEALQAMEKIADSLITEAMTGNIQAIKEIGDRIDGKPAQSIEATGLDGGAIRLERIERVITDPANRNA